MVPWKKHPIYKNLLEEVEKTTDVDELKNIAEKLIKENSILSHKLNITLRSLENQNSLINYLQNTLHFLIDQYRKMRSRLCGLLREVTRLTSKTARCTEEIAKVLLTEYEFEDLNKEDLERIKRPHTESSSDSEDLEEITRVPHTETSNDAELGENKYLAFLQKCCEKDEADEEGEETVVRRKRGRSSKVRNDKTKKFTRSRKRSYQEMNKSESAKSESRYNRKNYKRPKMAYSFKASPGDIGDTRRKKCPGMRRPKRKAEEMELGLSQMNDEQDFNNSDENSKYAKMALTESYAPVKNVCYSCNDSNIECSNLKSLVVKLTDVLTDPAAENDVYVARYKQANVFKDNEETEYKVVDDVDTSDDDGKVSGDDCEINSKSDPDDYETEVRKNASLQSNYSEASVSDLDNSDDENNQEQDAALAKSSADEDDNDVRASGNPASNGKKGPRTPPPPSPAPCEFRRGPHTPPGTGPDSEGRPL